MLKAPGCHVYLGEQATFAFLEEWADLLQIAAVADVLEIGTVLHVGDERTVTCADKCWAASS